MTADVELIHPAPGALRRAGDAFRRLAFTATAGWRLPALITLAAALTRFVRLGHPPSIVPLDETYYAPNGFGYMCHGADMMFRDNAGPKTCDDLVPTFAVHPPVGKLLIAVGIRIFGYDAFGWRAAAAFVGALSVLLMYLIGRRLWRNRWLAAAAALLLGVEGLQFVQSRLAMLDIFLSFFILLGVWLLLEDRARTPAARRRTFLYLSGASFGLAVATKWSAAAMLPVVIAVALAWEIVLLRDRREARADRADEEWEAPRETPPATPDVRPRSAPRDEAGPAILRLVVVFAYLPVAVYMLSYTPWFLSTKRFVPPLCHDTIRIEGADANVPKKGLAFWLCYQREIANYHRTLNPRDSEGKPIHPYMSQAWSWPWISRPAAHYFTTTCEPGGAPSQNNRCPSGTVVTDEEILGLPNPVIWWTGFFLALPLCLWWMIVRRDDVAALLVVLFAPLVLPWFVTPRPLFMFYMTPAVPLIVLMVVHVMHVWRLRYTAVAFVLAAVGAFVYFYPVLAAYPLPPDGAFGWESRIWFGHVIKGDCGGPPEAIRLLCWI